MPQDSAVNTVVLMNRWPFGTFVSTQDQRKSRELAKTPAASGQHSLGGDRRSIK